MLRLKKKHFFTKNRVEISNEYSAQKVRWNCTNRAQESAQKVDINVILMSIITRFHFFGIWLLLKHMEFLIIRNRLQVLHVFCFFVFYIIKKNWKCKTRVERVCCAITCCTFMLHSFLKDFNNYFQFWIYMISY